MMINNNEHEIKYIIKNRDKTTRQRTNKRMKKKEKTLHEEILEEVRAKCASVCELLEEKKRRSLMLNFKSINSHHVSCYLNERKFHSRFE
jgi:hypothetical protein